MLYNQFITTKNADEAFEHWFGLLSNMGDISGSRDGDVVGEVINAVTVIEGPTQNIMKNKHKVIISVLLALIITLIYSLLTNFYPCI